MAHFAWLLLDWPAELNRRGYVVLITKHCSSFRRSPMSGPDRVGAIGGSQGGGAVLFAIRG